MAKKNWWGRLCRGHALVPLFVWIVVKVGYGEKTSEFPDDCAQVKTAVHKGGPA